MFTKKTFETKSTINNEETFARFKIKLTIEGENNIETDGYKNTFERIKKLIIETTDIKAQTETTATADEDYLIS